MNDTDTSGDTPPLLPPRQPYPRHGGEIPASPSFPADRGGPSSTTGARTATFEASVATRDAGPGGPRENEYVFYDGPPFANGLAPTTGTS